MTSAISLRSQLRYVLAPLLLFVTIVPIASGQPDPFDRVPVPDLDEIFEDPDSVVATSSAASSSVSSRSGISELFDFDSPNAKPTPSDLDGAHVPRRNLGVLELEQHLAKSKFEKQKGLEERATLVRVYERMAIALCFPSIAALVAQHSGEPDPRCNEILTELGSLHKNNTIITCFQQGLDSLECARAFEVQTVRPYRYGEYERLKLTLQQTSPLDSPAVSARFETLKAKMQRDIEAFNKEGSITNLKRMDASLFAVLSILCSDDGLELSVNAPEVSPTPGKSLTGSELSLSEAIDALEAKGKGKKPTAAPTVLSDDNAYFRTRLLSSACYDTISDALDIDVRIPSATCFRDGFLAPSCLSALRRLKTLQDPPTKAGSVGSNSSEDNRDGLASF